MSPKKTRARNIDNDINRLTRKPLYPELNVEKEKKYLSSDDSPEKEISPSYTRSLQDATNHLKHRSSKNLMDKSRDIDNQNISPNSKYSEHSDVDMEIDDFDDSNSQENEVSESSPDRREDKCLYKSEGFKNTSKDKRNVSSGTSDCYNFLQPLMFLIVCSIIFIISVFYFSFYIRDPNTSHVNDQLSATTLVNSLKSEFAKQPSMTFRIIHSALKNVLEMQPKSPAIILLLATNGSKNVCNDFANKLVDSLSVPKFTLKITGKDFKQTNVNKAKMDIDKKIEKTLKINQLGSVLIDDLDQIPGKAALILHKYYDHENAPFKKAIFVMTINYNKAISDYSDLKVWDKAANDHLLSVWTDTDVDQVAALLSRLTVSVAIITHES